MKFKSLPHLESPSKKRRREGNQESHIVDGQLLSTMIKDLRSKRVFSTKLIGRSPTKPGKRVEKYNEENEEKKDELGNNGDVNYGVPSTVHENRTGLNAGAREELEDIVGIVKSVDSNSNFGESKVHGGISNIDQENNGSFGVSKRAAVFDDGRLQKTPPDSQMVSLHELNENGGSKLAAVMQSSDREKCNGFDSNSKPRLMLKPCFKRKLFRAPGSFSYKRLLPYLVDIAGGTLDDDQATKLDNGLEKSPTSNLNDFCKEYIHGDSGNCPQNLPSSTTESSHGINPKSESPKDSTKSSNPIYKNSSFKEPCSKPSIGSHEVHKSSDAYHDRVVEGSEVGKDALTWESPRDNEQIKNRVVRVIDCPFPCKVQTIPSANSKFLDITSDLSITEPEIDRSMVKIGSGKLCIADNQSDGAIEFLKGKDYANEAQLMCCQENAGKRMRHNLLDSDPGLSRTSNGREDPRSNTNNNKNKLNIRNKFVRDPLIQLKLFGDPRSFSYKRLLPFITDLVEDNTNDHVPSGDDEFPKLEEGKTMEVHPRVEDSSCEKSCMNESIISEFNVKQPTSDPNTDLPLSPTMCSTSGKVGSIAPSDVISELTAITEELQPEQVISDQLETESCMLGEQLDLEIDQNVSSLEPNSRPESFHQERTKLFQEPFVIDPIGLELKRTHLEVPSPSKTPSPSLRKGILKKNPRGCRGLCSCLSCSSFRLNAERAFEFSSNLMLDAEEVASDLMKELSYTRTMLEIAVDWINDESGVRVDQVKEACRKTSAAETLAKGRLSQMNYELNIHSRIQCWERPNVKFAANVEQKVIEDTGKTVEDEVGFP